MTRQTLSQTVRNGPFTLFSLTLLSLENQGKWMVFLTEPNRNLIIQRPPNQIYVNRPLCWESPFSHYVSPINLTKDLVHLLVGRLATSKQKGNIIGLCKLTRSTWQLIIKILIKVAINKAPGTAKVTWIRAPITNILLWIRVKSLAICITITDFLTASTQLNYGTRWMERWFNHKIKPWSWQTKGRWWA